METPLLLFTVCIKNYFVRQYVYTILILFGKNLR